jgi:hypothetical protein
MKKLVRLILVFAPSLALGQYVACDPLVPSNHCLRASTEQQLSNHRYYTNTTGNVVHAPARDQVGTPSSASARCADGS